MGRTIEKDNCKGCPYIELACMHTTLNKDHCPIKKGRDKEYLLEGDKN